jgi:hypothetical protein
LGSRSAKAEAARTIDFKPMTVFIADKTFDEVFAFAADVTSPHHFFHHRRFPMIPAA